MEGSGYRGHDIPIVWSGTRVRAWVPRPLADQGFELGTRAIRLTERAVASVATAGNRSALFGPLSTLLLRSEGVASSFIEGLRSPLADVAAAEVGGTLGDAASYVADNLGAVVGALASSRSRLTEVDLHLWHRRLMESGGALPPPMVGAYRTEQSWIGGTSPRDAAYVPPPPELVGELMEDLVAFANDDALDPVTQAAVVHAQFESIHPYGDGNGRIGRILIGWVLSHRLDLTVPPPVSVLIARDPGGYLAGMTLFRMGHLDAWVEWMAVALERSSEAAVELLARSEELLSEWRVRLVRVREDAVAHRVIDLLAEQPVLSAATIADRLGVSLRSGQSALVTLARHGIVERYRPEATGPGRPTQYFMASELLELVSGWPGR